MQSKKVKPGGSETEGPPAEGQWPGGGGPYASPPASSANRTPQQCSGRAGGRGEDGGEARGRAGGRDYR
jgi:hypothetical protein